MTITSTLTVCIQSHVVLFMHSVHCNVSKLSRLTKVTLALLNRNLLGIDFLNLGSTRALVEMLDELVKRALVALGFTSHL